MYKDSFKFQNRWNMYAILDAIRNNFMKVSILWKTQFYESFV